MRLRSPISGAPLVIEGHVARAPGGERWPVIEGIPYLRVGRELLVSRALAMLDSGDRDGALVTLLADQDDWWKGPPADPEKLRRLIWQADVLTLRDAVALLGLGPVGDYFLHRWSDPTYLAGLALLEAHWTGPETAFELACGIGHYLRDLARRGVTCGGGDVVFAKLWLARRFVVPPEVALVCFDAAHPWPIGDTAFDLVLCHDAFYFLPEQGMIAARLRATAPWQAVGHVHNSERNNFSAGHSLTSEQLQALFPDALLYDDAELTAALAERRTPRPQHPGALRRSEALAVAGGPALRQPPQPVIAGLALPPPGTMLRRNPLYEGSEIRWPSDRYAAEYGPLATYPPRTDAPEALSADAAPEPLVRRRELVDLPERW